MYVLETKLLSPWSTSTKEVVANPDICEAQHPLGELDSSLHVEQFINVPILFPQP